ncbi:MAG: lasso RiPP family leader peptide-containing protein, partial [Bdellovibrionales bacterium]|nr:lasso RiPP family leader peptide-containing protein [Bdellovibrionales bacterium]
MSTDKNVPSSEGSESEPKEGNQKKVYEAPRLTKMGSVASLTTMAPGSDGPTSPPP